MKTKFCGCCLFSVLMVPAAGAGAEEEAPVGTPPEHAAAQFDETVPASDGVALEAEHGALRKLAKGRSDDAASELKDAILRCKSSPSCSDEMSNRLYFALGIALSSAQDQRHEAVVAFRQGLQSDPDRELEPLWDTSEARSALEEARESPASPSPIEPRTDDPSTLAETAIDDEGSSENESEDSSPFVPEGRVVVLVHAIGSTGYGVPMDYGPTSDFYFSQAGAGLTLGIMPGEGRFTVGGRFRGGLFFNREDAFAMAGVDALFGQTLGPGQKENFGYLLFGPGLEYFPALRGLGASGQAILGWSFKHISFGANGAFGLGSQFSHLNLGVHLGYGGLR